MPADFESDFEGLKQKLLMMAGYAEAAVNRAVRALVRRDDDLARSIRDADTVIDALEKEIDHQAIELLSQRPSLGQLRLVTMAMKIAHNLERVGDEATTISRRCVELCLEPQLRHANEIPPLAHLALQMLRDGLDAFVQRDCATAQAVVPRDREVDGLYKTLRAELADYMQQRPTAISRCLSLMIVAKALERIADHAANIAEEVVYMYEGRDIRHRRGTESPPRAALSTETL